MCNSFLHSPHIALNYIRSFVGKYFGMCTRWPTAQWGLHAAQYINHVQHGLTPTLSGTWFRMKSASLLKKELNGCEGSSSGSWYAGSNPIQSLYKTHRVSCSQRWRVQEWAPADEKLQCPPKVPRCTHCGPLLSLNLETNRSAQISAHTMSPTTKHNQNHKIYPPTDSTSVLCCSYSTPIP